MPMRLPGAGAAASLASRAEAPPFKVRFSASLGVIYGRRGRIPWATRRNSLDSLLVNRDTTTAAAVSKVLDVGVAVVYRGRGGIS